jgi:ribosome-associated toxin RatA of RatAB toxin-antitoxin module
MRTIRLRAEIDADPAEVFATVAEFDRWPALATDVRAVVTTASTAGQPRESYWEVNFRRGVMRWREAEVVDPVLLRIDFDRTDGDFEDFHGSWQVFGAPGGPAEALFEVTYDFGIESLAGLMDPIAERVIKRSVCEVLNGQFDGVRVVEGAEALTDLGTPLVMTRGNS